MSLTTINAAKELAQGYTPLFLYDFTFGDGSTLSVCEHAITYLGVDYEARVLSQQISAIEALSQTGISVPPDIRLTLADADKALFAMNQSSGFRGARVTVTFVYYDFRNDVFSSDAAVPFLGRCSRPDITDDTLTVQASYILNLAAKMVPNFPLQPRCPKIKPRSADQVALADVRGSLFYDCGSTTTDDCGFTKTGCAANNDPLRFGGIVYEIPPASRSREYVSGNWLTDLRSEPSAAAYGDYAPIGFGTAWVDCKGLGSWPEGNSTRGEAIVCEGKVKNILKVTVEDEVLPPATDLDGNALRVEDVLFRYNVISRGDRTGALNTDAPWNGNGDPHGSLCVIAWCVHRKLVSGSTPRIRALVQFEDVPWYQEIDSISSGVVTFANNAPNTNTAGNPPYTVTISGNSNPALNGTFELTSWSAGPPGTVTLSGTTASGTGGYIQFDADSSNYAFAILKLLRRSGLDVADADLSAFVRASNWFKTQVSYVDLDGETRQHDRYSCSLVISQRRSVQEVITGMLRACNSHLGRNPLTGNIALYFRAALADQQPTLPAGSNYSTAVDGGYLAYHFDESSIARDAQGRSTLSQPGRSGASVPNSVQINFANSDRDYSGDSTRIIDSDDINRMGQEIAGSFPDGGINTLDHAKRAGATYLAEQLEGEPWEWESTAKGVRLQVGQIVGLSNTKHGFSLQPMRLQKIAPSPNFERAKFTATVHGDAWYDDSFGQSDDPERGDPRRNRLARPAFAWLPYKAQPASGDPLYAISEWSYKLQVTYAQAGNGDPQIAAVITGKRPVNEPADLLAPVLSQQGTTSSSGGSLLGSGRVYFIALASRLNGKPGPLSNVCQVAVAQGGTANTITAAVRYADAGADGYYVFAGRNPMRLSSLNDAGYSGSPGSSITVTSVPEATWGAPDTEFDRIIVRPRLVWHAGVFGAAITAVGTRTITIAGAGWTSNQWTDYDCIVLSKQDLSAIGILQYRVASNTATVLTIRSDNPDPNTAGVSAGDVLVMMSKPSVSGLVVTDANWQNTLSNGGAGLATNQEAGRVLRIVAGAGRGYRYLIASNTSTAITVYGPWIVTPDSTSRYVIEDAAPLPAVESAPLSNSDQTAEVSISVPVENYLGKTLLFEVATRDGGDHEPAPFLHPVRMAYIAGAQGTRVVTSDTTQRVTDGTLLCDTSGVTGTTTTLTAAITDTTTEDFHVASGTNIKDGTYIQIGTEKIGPITGGGTTNPSGARGALGTTAATHSNGATVNVPGALTVQLLEAAAVPNQELLVTKTTDDIHYVDIVSGGDDTFPEGGSHKYLPDSTEANGSTRIKFPG